MPSWLKDAVFYEIYPQSFRDTNADGIGDFNGIIEKLDYIADLGCNALWINPCFDSPFKDAGYDVRDYKKTAERYGNYCAAVARNILADDRDAEECVNDTWLAAWNSMPVNRPARLAPYLGKITRNLALDRWAERRALKRGGGAVTLALEELDECIPAGGGVEEEILRRELADAVRRFVHALGQTERNVFLLRYWYVCPVAEIAGRFGFSESKVKSMLLRTRKKLRAFLEKEALV